jgi:hypothetical protein
MTELQKNIIKLRNDGKTYTQICNELGCSKSIVCYHLGKNQKENHLKRQRKNRSKEHPYLSKLYNFIYIKQKSIKTKNQKSTYKQRLLTKIYAFHNSKRNKQVSKDQLNFTIDDILNKLGKNPKCYLTGVDIDINDTKSYNFDHIIPVSRGGTNTLDNLGICTKQANQAKNNMTPDEFINLCKLVVSNSI